MGSFHDIIVERFVESCTGPFLAGEVHSDASLPPNIGAKESVGNFPFAAANDLERRKYQVHNEEERDDSLVAPSSSSFCASHYTTLRVGSDRFARSMLRGPSSTAPREEGKHCAVPCGTIHFNATCSHERSAL